MDYEFFMKKALEQAERAMAAGEFPVGCVLVYQDEILVSGSRRSSIGDRRNELDHAEIVALRRLAQMEAPLDHRQITAFSTLEPCLMCYSALILAGIGRVVYAYEDVMGGGTGCDLSRLTPLYKHSRIKVVPGILRAQSLELFKNYYADSANDYLRHSLLVDHILGA